MTLPEGFNAAVANLSLHGQRLIKVKKKQNKTAFFLFLRNPLTVVLLLPVVSVVPRKVKESQRSI